MQDKIKRVYIYLNINKLMCDESYILMSLYLFGIYKGDLFLDKPIMKKWISI